MDMISDGVLIAFMTLIGGLVGAFLAKMSSDKERYLTNITQERRDWRDEIRKLTKELYVDPDKPNKYELLRAEFAIRLNPDDEEDNNILSSFDSLIKLGDEKLNSHKKLSKKGLKYIKEIVDGVARLLKYDWERAKSEAAILRTKPIFIGLNIFYILFFIGNLTDMINKVINKWRLIMFLINSIVLYLFLYYLIKNLIKYAEKHKRFMELLEFFDIPFRKKRGKRET